MVAGFGFRGPQYGGLQPGPRPQAPVWGPPDMSQQLQNGIAGIADKFGSAFKATSEWGAKEQQANALMGMAGPGGPYGSPVAGGGGGPVQGSPGGDAVGGYNRQGKTPSFVQMQGGAPDAKLGGLIESTAATYKLAPDYLTKLGTVESGNNPQAFNKGSKASGWGQFIPSTWQRYGGNASPFDPGANVDATARLTVDNANVLRQGLGREPTQGELYLAHQQGAGGALALLKNPDAPAVSVTSRRNIMSNLPASMRGRGDNITAGEFSGMWTSKFGDAPAFQQATPQQAQAQQTAQTSTVPAQAPAQRDPRLGKMTYAEIVAQDKAAGRTPPPMPSADDQQTASAVVQNNAATQQQRTAEARQAPAQSFMGTPVDPSLKPGGAVSAPGSGIPQFTARSTMSYNQDPVSGQGGGVDPNAKVLPPGVGGGPSAYPGSGGAPVDVPPPTGAPIQSQAPAAVAQPQQAPAATPVAQAAPVAAQPAPAPISGGGDGRPLQGNPSRDQIANQAAQVAVQQHGIDPQLAKYLAAGIRAGDPQASALATQILGTHYGATKPQVAEVNGELVRVNPDGTATRIYGSPTQKAPEVRDINGVSSQWNGQQWVPLGGGQPGSQFRIVQAGDASSRKQFGINPEDKRDYQINLKTGEASPIAPVSTREDPSFDRERDLRNDMEGRQETKNYQIMERSLDQMETALQNPSGAGDLSLIFNYMRILDPQSAVREGEFALAGQTSGAAGAVANLYNRVLTGERLTDTQREEFANRAQRLTIAGRRTYESVANPIRDQATRNNINPDAVAPLRKREMKQYKVSRDNGYNDDNGAQAPAAAVIDGVEVPIGKIDGKNLPIVGSQDDGEKLARGTEYWVQGESTTRRSRGTGAAKAK